MYWCDVCDGVFEYPLETERYYPTVIFDREFEGSFNYAQVCPFCETEYFGDKYDAIYKCNDCENVFTEFPKLGHECCPNCRSIDYKEMEGEDQ